MKKNLNVFWFMLLVFLFCSKTVVAQNKGLTLEEITRVSLVEKQSGAEYEIWIKLPEDYQKNPHKHYPVIYVTDAKWHINMLSGATDYILPNAIVVAITWQKNVDGEPWQSRAWDFSPTKSAKSKGRRGEAKRFLHFIQQQIFTYVEGKYRTKPNERTYFGYSFGGLFGAYVLLKQPDTFRFYVLGSPTLAWDDNYIARQFAAASPQLQQSNVHVFLSYGELESKLGQGVEAFTRQLKTITGDSFSSKLTVIKESTHSSAFPVTAVKSVQWLAKHFKGDKE